MDISPLQYIAGHDTISRTIFPLSSREEFCMIVRVVVFVRKW